MQQRQHLFTVPLNGYDLSFLGRTLVVGTGLYSNRVRQQLRNL